MKLSIVLIFCAMNAAVFCQNGKATTVKKTFNRTTDITQEIDASVDIIWGLLTDAANFPTWNSTVISIEGTIALGEKIKLKSTLDSTRTFKLKVKEMEPNKRLVWVDAMGKRTYTLSQEGGKTIFGMHEKIGSPMFPLFAGKIPSFDQNFEQFVADLKTAAEAK